MTRHYEQTLRTLAEQPSCTDAAIASLERLSNTNARALSDLAAAYYLRAERHDRPVDLVRALNAAQVAAQSAPSLAEPRFNRALIEGMLGLNDDAVKSWNVFRSMDQSPWAAEAVRHVHDLERSAGRPDGPRQWQLHRERILTASENEDVAQWIKPFPSLALRLAEEELLPEWDKHLPRLRRIAHELERLTGDPYLADGVAALENAPADRRAVLQRAHTALRAGRLADRALDRNIAARHYTEATELFAQSDSPFALGAAVAAGSFLRPELSLDRIAQKAQKRNYLHVLGRTHHTRAYHLLFENRYIESLGAYAAALAIALRTNDSETAANIHIRRAGIFGVLNQHDAAWREIFFARGYWPLLVELKERHQFLGTIAREAAALGYPRIGLQFIEMAVRGIQQGLASTPPEDLPTIRGLQQNLGVVLRTRAEIEIQSGQPDRARADLAEAIRLSNEIYNIRNRDDYRALAARLEEVKGQAALADEPARAIESFTRALEFAGTEHYRTFRANLLAQRAEAYQRAGGMADAENDLTAALDEIRAEETNLLSNRKRGQSEDVWSTYFSRFQETYRRLIRLRIDQKRYAEAFTIAERARAFEPLQLVLDLDVVAPSFRRLLGEGVTVDLERLQSQLAPKTFVIEYCVLDDRTYAFIVSREQFVVQELPVRRRDIGTWAWRIQRAGRGQRRLELRNTLHPPYDALLAKPLAAIKNMPGGLDPERRLVVIPDGPIHGLPIHALRDRITERHVIQDATVSIAGSATLYVHSLHRDAMLASAPVGSVLILGDPTFDPEFGRGLPRLAAARREAESIHALYAPRAQKRLAENATVDALLDGGSTSMIIHFAGHAIAHPHQPTHSLLLLAPSTTHRGTLEARELLERARFHDTRVFVLSACSSAGGVPVGPEGVAPLVRPILAAGVPAVVGALWEVSDETTEPLLVAFHQHYRAGTDVATALRRAQLGLLENPNAGPWSVLAWAPFQAIGHAESPFAPASQTTRSNSQ